MYSFYWYKYISYIHIYTLCINIHIVFIYNYYIIFNNIYLTPKKSQTRGPREDFKTLVVLRKTKRSTTMEKTKIKKIDGWSFFERENLTLWALVELKDLGTFYYGPDSCEMIETQFITTLYYDSCSFLLSG